MIVPVGWPSRDREIRLLTAAGDHVAVGETGEIVVRSRHLAGGFWGAPDLTADAFRPVDGDPEAREYRTGDLGRFRPDGALEHLGRRDFVVKFRAHRVNLVELENLAAARCGVRAAAAKVRTAPDRAEQLILWVQPEEDAEVCPDQLRGCLAQHLPPGCVPTKIVVVTDLPRTPGGKLDRSALPDPPAASATDSEGSRDPLERRLAEAWREVIGCELVDVDQDFFDLGGDSIRASALLNRLQAEFRRTLSPTLLFEEGTIRTLAERIRAEAEVAGPITDESGQDSRLEHTC